MDPKILEQIEALERLRHARTDHWQVPRVEGDLLYQIALVSSARLVVEVGTSYGFSGLHWGAALKSTGGRLHTIDISRRKFDESRETFARAGLAGVITNHLGDAREVLRGVEGPIDIVFLDADKESCRAYFDLVWPKVRPGGSVITDNATTHRQELAGFVRHVRSSSDASSIEVAVGNGIEWTVKLGPRS